MRDLTQEDRDAICQHATHAYPFECCGVITETGVIRCENVAADRAHRIQISSAELARIGRKQKIVGFYHSHINQTTSPSDHDKNAAMTTMGYVIVNVATAFGGHATEIALFESVHDGRRKYLVRRMTWGLWKKE